MSELTNEIGPITTGVSTSPLIFGKLLALRRAIGGLRAKTSTEAYGPKFPVKSSKELMFKLREAVDDLDLVAYILRQEVIPMVVDPVADQKSGGTKAGGSCCYVTAVVRIEAADGSFRDFHGCGCGMDRDDKAAGKASTYAWKDALLKGLSIPDADMVDSDDESGQGATVKPKAVAPRKPAAAKGADLEAQALTSIQSAGSLEQLEGLKGLLTRLPEAAQERLTPAYRARKAELSLGGGKGGGE